MVSSNMCSFVEGDYEGEELYVHGVGKLCIKSTWYEFDGRNPHLTCPITSGSRYSLIFYTNQKYGGRRRVCNRDTEDRQLPATTDGDGDRSATGRQGC